MGAATGTAKRKCCDCGSDPICPDKIASSSCPSYQQFIILTVSAGTYSGNTYLLYQTSTSGSNLVFTRVNPSGVTVTMIISPADGGFHDVVSLDINGDWQPSSCTDFTATISVHFRIFTVAERLTKQFSIQCSGVADGSSSTCACSMNTTKTASYSSSSGQGAAGTDGYILLPFTGTAPSNTLNYFSSSTPNSCPSPTNNLMYLAFGTTGATASYNWEVFSSGTPVSIIQSAAKCTTVDTDPFDSFVWSGPWDYTSGDGGGQCDFSSASFTITEL